MAAAAQAITFTKNSLVNSCYFLVSANQREYFCFSPYSKKVSCEAGQHAKEKPRCSAAFVIKFSQEAALFPGCENRTARRRRTVSSSSVLSMRTNLLCEGTSGTTP